MGTQEERWQKLHAGQNPKRKIGFCKGLKLGRKPAPRIIIVMDGGIIQNVVKKGTRIKVEVRDFDVESDDDVDLRKDKNGQPYYESIY